MRTLFQAFMPLHCVFGFRLDRHRFEGGISGVLRAVGCIENSRVRVYSCFPGAISGCSVKYFCAQGRIRPGVFVVLGPVLCGDASRSGEVASSCLNRFLWTLQGGSGTCPSNAWG